MNGLMNDTRNEYLREGLQYRGGFFEVNGRMIIPSYDVPHLMKGIRNNLIKNELCFTMDGKEMRANWKYVEELYEFDRNDTISDLRLLPKLNDCHVKSNQSEKMKVKYCVQVFSQRVAAIMRHLARKTSHDIDPKAEDTALLLLLCLSA